LDTLPRLECKDFVIPDPALVVVHVPDQAVNEALCSLGFDDGSLSGTIRLKQSFWQRLRVAPNGNRSG
jgi:hypothetical protein